MVLYRIVRKEMLENLMSLRFVFSLVLTISLFATTSFIFVDDHREQLDDYSYKTNQNLAAFGQQSAQLYKLAFYDHHIYRRPKLLALCAEGFEASLPAYFTFNAFTINLPQLAGQSNFTLPHFTNVDWAFIVSLIFSFAAFVFTYDSICGEKERGTLRLILAGPIPRVTILLGKYLGLVLTLVIPLLLSLLISLIIVITSRVDVINPAIWIRILSLVALSLLYVSIFVFLGLFVSSRTAHPANSMAILLLVWVTMIILIPSLGRVISDRFYRAATAEEFERAKSEARKKIDDRFYAGAYGSKAGGTAPNRDDPAVDPPGRARYTNEETAARNRVVDAQHNRMLAQAEAGRSFTYISPAVIYRRICELMAGTGIDRSKSLYRQIKMFQQSLREYVLLEDQGDPRSLHLLFDDEPRVAAWTTISHKSVNFEAVPKFQERDLALGQFMKLAIWDIGLLVLFNLFFFAASFVSFLRYDVR